MNHRCIVESDPAIRWTTTLYSHLYDVSSILTWCTIIHGRRGRVDEITNRISTEPTRLDGRSMNGRLIGSQVCVVCRYLFFVVAMFFVNECMVWCRVLVDRLVCGRCVNRYEECFFDREMRRRMVHFCIELDSTMRKYIKTSSTASTTGRSSAVTKTKQHALYT